MKAKFGFLLVVVLCAVFVGLIQGQQGGKKKGKKKNGKEASSWTAEEYSGARGEKELLDAFASKGFSWITGSPADNEKLSVGKNAQFFGFVALRYQSGRAASRGTLGRAFYAICDDRQRAILENAVLQEKTPLQQWWLVREEILTILEDHLYSGTSVDQPKYWAAGEKFSLLNAMVATYEASAFARLEDSLTAKQKQWIDAWRKDPESAGKSAKSIRVEMTQSSDRKDGKQLEDLYAKAFSWLTGTAKDNEIIPIGQPAQFFGFVSIRHKSGHAASRGKIAKDFLEILTPSQQTLLQQAIQTQIPVVRQFLEKRHLFLNQLSALRTHPDLFNPVVVHQLARDMGTLEMQAARIEAETYRKIRVSMTEAQLAEAMKMRGEYTLDESQVNVLNPEERGQTLAILCVGCHGMPGQYRQGLPGPNLDGFWKRPIASSPQYEYSNALTQLRQNHQTWTPQLLDQYLTAPKKFAPGTKMEFQGLLKAEDRKALIEYLQRTR